MNGIVATLLCLTSMVTADLRGGYSAPSGGGSFSSGGGSFSSGGGSFSSGGNSFSSGGGSFSSGGGSHSSGGGGGGGALSFGDGCGNGQVRKGDGSCVTPQVTRNIFLYAAPPNQQIQVGPPPQLPDPKVHYNFVFVRTPTNVGGSRPVVVPPPKQKTLVYVLSKRPNAQNQEIIEVPSTPTQPEVFFVNYNQGDNPDLPGGINLQQALSQSVQQGQFINGGSNNGGGGSNNGGGGSNNGGGGYSSGGGSSFTSGGGSSFTSGGGSSFTSGGGSSFIGGGGSSGGYSS